MCVYDAAPFAYEAPCAEQIGLHGHPIEAMHSLRGVDAVEDDGGAHGLSLEIVPVTHIVAAGNLRDFAGR